MISLMLFTLTACGSEDPAEEISRALHIDVSAGEEIPEILRCARATYHRAV